MDKFFLYFLLLSFLAGCGIREREVALEKREAALAQKEQQLILREQSLVKDSIERAKPDSSNATNGHIVPRPLYAIAGTWHVKMTCRETSCAGSAVGDTKSENWTFEGDSSGVIAKVMSGNTLVRVYAGALAGNTLVLSNAGDNTVQPQNAKINVRINLDGEKSKSGTREILREEGCKILYELKLEKQSL